MKFYCYRCCDEFKTEPCTFTIPTDAENKKDSVIAGLAFCPMEGLNYIKGVWVKNGEHYAAEWGKKR